VTRSFASLRKAAAWLLLALCTSTTLIAQSHLGVIVGTVKDSLGQPIPGVEITVLRAAVYGRTDTTGSFTLPGLPPGSVDISFRRLAYAPIILVAQVVADDTLEVDVKLGIVAQQLTGVIVQAHPAQLRELAAFESRRRQGIGHFITRAQIEDRHPLNLSDMVRMIPGTVIAAGDNGPPTLRFSRVGRNNCPPQYFVDGMQVTGFNIDDMPPQDVEGVELYAGAAGLPPEFNRMRSTVICGAVIIWTRIPGNAKPKP
jgi:hypothetical protein